MRRLFSDINVYIILKNSLLRYYYGSYVLFLRFVRSRVVVDWNKVMDHLLRLIETESSLVMGMNYIQELYLYLHIFRVYSVDTFLGSLNKHYNTIAKGLES